LNPLVVEEKDRNLHIGELLAAHVFGLPADTGVVLALHVPLVLEELDRIVPATAIIATGIVSIAPRGPLLAIALLLVDTADKKKCCSTSCGAQILTSIHDQGLVDRVNKSVDGLTNKKIHAVRSRTRRGPGNPEVSPSFIYPPRHVF
jgi:hypothetical protein